MAGPAGVLEDLRAATAAAHRELEETLGLLDPALDLAGYRRILGRFFGFWQGWQPRVALLLGDAAFTDLRDRRHLLQADLLSLGLSSAAIAALPVCPPPPLRDVAAALGSLYVMEGSTLGGRQILKIVAPRLQLGATRGAAYFAGYGEETGLMWREFLDRLVATPDPPATVQGATDTFAALSAWAKMAITVPAA